MITRAEVISIIPHEDGSVRYKVRIPILNGNGKTVQSTPDTYLSEAVLCTMPGVTNSIRVGDKVFVAFEQDLLGSPVIIGHLFTGDARAVQATRPDYRAKSITVSDDGVVVLPKNVKIGDYSYADFARLFALVNNKLVNQVDNSSGN